MDYDDRMRAQVLTRSAFQNTLRETIAWCATRVDAGNPSGSLRSVELCPEPSLTRLRLEFSYAVLRACVKLFEWLEFTWRRVS